MEWTMILAKLGAAVAAGGLVGLEREISGKAAGFRTNILICLGATVMSMIGFEMTRDLTEATRIIADPQRIGAGIITGIGFLGAGAIIQARGSIRGLTTAATIWVMAAIGLGIGAGYFALAGVATVTTMVVLLGLAKVEPYLARERTSVDYVVTALAAEHTLDRLRDCVHSVGVTMSGVRIEASGAEMAVAFTVTANPETHAALSRGLMVLDVVQGVRRAAGDAAP